jgi:hypothetical protein
MSNGFIGTFRNLENEKIGSSFVVGRLVGRNHRKEPRWAVHCTRCHAEQVMDHARVYALVQGAKTAKLLCANPSCELSREHHQSESLTDPRSYKRWNDASLSERLFASSKEFREFVKAEAEAQARAAQESVQQSTKAAQDQAKRQTEAAQVEALKAEYREVYLAQLCSDLPEKDICTFQRWTALPASARQAILNEIRTNPRSLIADFIGA